MRLFDDIHALENDPNKNNKKSDLAQAISGAGIGRRDFLRQSFAIALPAALIGIAGPALAAAGSAATASSYTLPSRQRGSTVRNVRNYGAVGNGVADDTAAFQAAINSLPSAGGTVEVPAGTYRIDAVTSVKLRSYMHLKLAQDAKIVAKPNSAERYNILYVNKVRDVEISGGQIIGERSGHNGTTGEWGHGIFVRGSSNVTIRDTHISKCWGDGLVVAGADMWQAPAQRSSNVFVANIVSTGNRRQAMSIGYVNDLKVYDSEFSNSNGATPQCGIDIEPENGNTSYKVLFENCLVRGNARYGMLLYKGSQGVTIRNCIVENNGSCGIVTRNATATYIVQSTIRNNSATGIFIQDGTKNCQISQNTSYGNYNRLGTVTRTPFEMSGWSPAIERDILIQGAVSDIRITTNYYR
ncbi:right-handed parallel beta-helix repeat-containing protein [Luteimonas sp. SX5]|uniref:Right-handed parallel beta-helix repeat-containing protein n=1 Tax=Luteimonas galliterrae TaxID=2940486 RepID=A0ABT0MJ44_9GAMM|nr:right-handed parallel beta-helix repeat-containing protein [Luteimonas galliterrae]MCL1634893.1 right-handed parallel beta-helix repeat-containing protein [Luteimonas galliterrae]